jgi:hypothetical protein
MLKTTIIAIMLLMISLSAGAGRLVMSHSDFIHLSDVEKDKYIIKLMELSIELESRYKHETAQHGFSQERFDRYSKILNQLKSALFIPSAYADSRGGARTSPTVRGGGQVRTNTSGPLKAATKDPRTWEGMAKDWNNLLKEKRDSKDTCIFAGWISRTVMIKGKPTCTHPDFIDGDQPNRHIRPNGEISKESFAYPYPKPGSKCGRDDKKMIQCNPLIFGYKKQSDESLFCVEAAEGAHNSSFNCMKAALNTEATDQDSREQRLKFLRDKLSKPENQALFNDVWGFTYKTCLCPTIAADSKGNKTFSQSYQDYMRPHRTCYGLMEMMADTANSCTPTDKFPMADTTIFKKLQEQIKRTGLTESQADTQYTNFLTTIQKDNATEYKAVCGDVPGVVVTPKEEVPVVKPEEPVVVTDPPKDPKYVCEASCESKTTAAVGETPAKTEYTCTFALKDENNAASTVAFESTPTEKPSKPEDTTLSVTNKIANKPVTLACALKVTQKAQEPVTADPDPTLSTTIDCQEKTCKIIAKPEGKHEGYSVKWKVKDPPQGETIVKDWEAATTTPTTLPGQINTGTTDTQTQAPAADKLEITQSKGKVAYEVCATLEKGPKKIPEAGSCQIVPALAAAPKPEARPAAAPAGAPNPQQGPPPVQIRGSSDTSAIGIK